MYYTESAVAKRHGKKFLAYKTNRTVIIHAIGGVLETVTGFYYIHTGNIKYAYFSAYIALFVHIPTGFILTPKVWGLKHITITGEY